MIDRFEGLRSLESVAVFLAVAMIGTLLAAPPTTVSLEPTYVITPEGKVAADRAAIHPGSTVGLALTWPESSRQNEPLPHSDLRFVVSEAEGEAAAADDFRIVRFLPKASSGRDVLEVLLVSLGTVEIPALEARSDDGRVIGRTDPLTIDVVPSLSDEDVETAPPRGLHAIPLEMVGLWMMLAAVLLLLALVATAVAIILRRRKPRAKRSVPPAAREPADERALRLLRDLLDSGLLERREIKLFCIRLADIGKEYIGAIADTHLEELTTTECIRALSRCGFDASRCRWLESWLHSIDMVKFAEDRPERSDLERLAADLRDLIMETKASIAAAEDGGAPVGER